MTRARDPQQPLPRDPSTPRRREFLYPYEVLAEDGASLTLDAGAVTTADSSALALMTALIRSARSRNMRVIVTSLPVALSSIVAIYGLQAILSPTEA